MNRLHVWITLPNGEIAALGDLAFGDSHQDGTAPGAFRYARQWLERADAVPANPDRCNGCRHRASIGSLGGGALTGEPGNDSVQPETVEAQEAGDPVGSADQMPGFR